MAAGSGLIGGGGTGGLGYPRVARRRQASAFPRPAFDRVVHLVVPLNCRGRREDRALAAPAAPCAMGSKNAHGLDRYSRDIPAFPAQWCYGFYVLSPVSGVVCHRRGMGPTTRLTPRSRRQDHTISPYAAAFRPAGMNPPDATASIATRTTFRDGRANVPHGGAGWLLSYRKSEFR
jgi:hypothetical protein